MKGDFIMAYRYGNREQIELFPPSIEDYVNPDDPVRAYDAFVEALDFDELGIILDENQVGNPEYYPKAMVKLLTFGYSYGIRSSRKLERATHHNVAFIWLTGGLRPDHKTIANFRKNNKGALKKILKQCVKLCITLGLIEGNTLFADGTKIRANASVKNTWTKEKCEKYLQHIDRHIESILSECEAIDEQEQYQQSLVKMKTSFKEKEILKSRVQEILKELKAQDKKAINTIDPECTRINSIQGSHAGYNAQAVVDEKHGLIVHADVVNENNDRQQFATQISQANETLGQKCKVACADQGYSTIDELETLDKQDIKVVAPPYEKSDIKKSFTYDSENDCYVCPEGHILKNRGLTSDKKSHVYRTEKKSLCLACVRFNTCTKSKRGKAVSRLLNEEARQRFEDQYNEPESQEIYKLRQQKVELPFGHIKRNLRLDAFLLRGRDGAKLEFSLLSSCFNIVRMMNIFGVKGLIQQLRGVTARGILLSFQRIAITTLNSLFYVKERSIRPCQLVL